MMFNDIHQLEFALFIAITLIAYMFIMHINLDIDHEISDYTSIYAYSISCGALVALMILCGFMITLNNIIVSFLSIGYIVCNSILLRITYINKISNIIKYNRIVKCNLTFFISIILYHAFITLLIVITTKIIL